MNACAGVCMYGNRGEFIRASQKMPRSKERKFRNALEALLPAGELRGKTVPFTEMARLRGRSDSY